MLTFSNRPDVPRRGGCATLCGCAHEVVPGDTITGRGSIFLGPRQACDGSQPGTFEQLRAAGVAAIVNCTMSVVNAFEDGGKIDYCRIAVRDEMGANLLPFMAGAADFIEEHVCKGASVLVHCERGVSRSATIVMAHQIRFGPDTRVSSGADTPTGTREAAYVAVKSVRQVAEPNAGFWEQLGAFQQQQQQYRQHRQHLRQEQRQNEHLHCTTSAPSAGVAAGTGAGARVKGDVAFASTGTCVAPSACQPEYDEAWAHESQALFATRGREACVRALPRSPSGKLAGGQEGASTGGSATARCAEAALDYVYGRGCIESDLRWLATVCGALEGGAGSCAAPSRPAVAVVASLLRPHSEWFTDKWAGEYRERYVSAMRAALGISAGDS